MNRNSYLLRAFAPVLAVSAAMPCLAQNKKELPPNIIIVLTDDMGYGDIGTYGGKFVPTPHIDRMAEEGLKFDQYYSASPISSASRCGLLTGMHPGKWHITSYLQSRAGNKSAEMADYLDPAAPTLPKEMKKAGYATGHFGKWHLGGGRDVHDAPPFNVYGYDEYCSTYESPQPDPLLTATNWIWSPEDSIKRWNRTAYFVDKTLDFLRRHAGEPCFVNLWPDDMHTPWVGDPEQQRLFPDGQESENNFRTVLAEYDRQIGRLLDEIDKMKLENNTIVIFTSDNGPAPSFRGSRTGNMRGVQSLPVRRRHADALYHLGYERGDSFRENRPYHRVKRVRLIQKPLFACRRAFTGWLRKRRLRPEQSPDGNSATPPYPAFLGIQAK